MAFPQYQPNLTYGHCDTYFVEAADDHGIYAQRAAARDQARKINHERQLELGDELSKITSVEYQDEILRHMQSMEVIDFQHRL